MVIDAKAVQLVKQLPPSEEVTELGMVIDAKE
jgi:hypothetical protein